MHCTQFLPSKLQCWCEDYENTINFGDPGYPYFQTKKSNPMLVEMSFSWTWYSRPFCTHFLQRGQSRHSPCQFQRTFHSGVALSTASHPSTWTWIHLLKNSAVHSEDSAIWVHGCSKHSYRHDHIFGLYNLQESPRLVLLSRATNRAGQANILSYPISYMTSAHFFKAWPTLWLFNIAMGNGPFIEGLP